MRGRIGEQEECRSLGKVFAERVVQDEGVVPSLVRWYFMNSLRNLVCLASSYPTHLLQPNTCQLVHYSGAWVRCRAMIFGSIDSFRGWRRRNGRKRGRETLCETRELSRMLKYPEIDGLLMRLDGPGDCILPSDCYPSDKIALDDMSDASTCGLDTVWRTLL
jgi:hypothetical protein